MTVLSQTRTIMHVDMDAFFASVEQRDRPELAGLPVLVGGDGPRGVVAAASYEARKFGCHSAQPTAVAKRLCPQAVVVSGRHGRYREVSEQVFAVFDDFTPIVQPLSIDEAFLDMTGTEPLLGKPEAVARRIKQRITRETGLTASVGIAPNKFLAKLASDMDKPDGLTIIPPDRIQQILDPLPIGAIWGIGPAAEKKLARLGVSTIADLRALDEAVLAARLGSLGRQIHRLARGIDDRPVVPDGRAKSIGHESTFAHDIDNPDQVRRVLLGHVEQVARRLRKHGRRARTITLKVRYGDFETITRARTLAEPTNVTDDLWQATLGLYEHWMEHEGFRPVRLIGMTTSHLERDDGSQLDLFQSETDSKRHAIDEATDAVVKKFGKGAIRRGGTMRD